MFGTPRLLAALMLLASQPAALRAQLEGSCYDVSVGTWLPIDSSHVAAVPRPRRPDLSGDSVYYSLPPRVQLRQDAPYPDAPADVHRLWVPDNALQVPHSFMSWQADGDSLLLRMSTGFAGTTSRLTRSGVDWVGWAQTFSDVIGVLRFKQPVRLTRVDCDTRPSAPASADRPVLRGFDFEGVGRLDLGDTLPTAVRISPRRSGAVLLELDASGLWAGADTVVARLGSGGRLQHLELRYPEGHDLGDAMRYVREHYGPGVGLPNSGATFWENRTTTFFISLNGTRPRAVLIDPRNR